MAEDPNKTVKKKKKKRALTAEEKRAAEVEYQNACRRAYVGIFEKIHADTVDAARAAEEAELMLKHPELVSPPPPVLVDDAVPSTSQAPQPAATKPSGKK